MSNSRDSAVLTLFWLAGSLVLVAINIGSFNKPDIWSMLGVIAGLYLFVAGLLTPTNAIFESVTGRPGNTRPYSETVVLTSFWIAASVSLVAKNSQALRDKIDIWPAFGLFAGLVLFVVCVFVLARPGPQRRSG